MPDWSDGLDISGRHRNYTCHLPAHVASPQALVVVLHGRNLTVAEMRRITHFDTIADRYGFLVVYPEGYGRSWNDGRGNTPAQQDGVDDVSFVRSLIDRLVEQHAIDPSRVGSTGISNGGVMCHRLGLELGDRIAAIAPVAGTMPVIFSEVTPLHAVSVLSIHGTHDRAMPVEGGSAHGLARALLALGGIRTPAGPVLSLMDTADRWRLIDRCANPTTGHPLFTAASDPT